MIIGKPVFYVHNGAGAEVLQTFTIPVPKQPWRTLQYAYFVQGAGNAINNSLQAKLTKALGGATFTNVSIGGTIFSSTVTNTGAGAVAALAHCSHLEWLVRSNAGSANQFILVVVFWDL